MNEPIEINVNDYVWFKLTPHGRDVWREWRRSAFADINADRHRYNRPLISDEPPSAEPDGYHHLQMWHFMEIFGQHCGITKDACFEPTIRLEMWDLVK